MGHAPLTMQSHIAFLHCADERGAVDLALPDEFIDACKANIDLAWLVDFLKDFASLTLDFKQAV
eukprot:4863944-Pleurochrysis_carterae.AAC.1